MGVWSQQEVVEMVAGECMVDLTTAERALERCNNNVHEAISHLTVQSSADWRRQIYGD